jgi:enoyl-CoA hydratase/carnithine racemase
MTPLAACPGLTLSLTHWGTAATLLIDRTDKANAFTGQMWDEVPRLVDAAVRAGARALLLRSATDTVFCAGADVAEYRANAGSVEWGLANHARVTAATDALHHAPIATIAAIAGPCAGGGVGLVTACDLRVASEDAVFAVPPAKLGLIYPQPDTARLIDLVGPAAAKRLLLTAGRVDAAWALRTGLVDEVVPLAELDTAAAGLVAQIAAGAPVSVRAMKTTIDLALGGVRTETDATRALLSEALQHPDHREGTAAFLERRAPRFDDPA